MCAILRPRTVPGLLPDRDSGSLLTVSASVREGCTLVRLDGEADVTVRGRLCSAVTAQIASGAPDLVVDLSGLSFVDCSCLQVLWQASRTAQEAGVTLRLAAPQPAVARAMELWGTAQVIGVHGSVAEALTAVPPASLAR